MRETAPEPTASPPGKRSRDPEDEVYLDNLRSHKRYLSEIMASSLNGLTFGETISENLLESPARSEAMLCARDDVSFPCSPMSEDSDDSRYADTTFHTCSGQPDNLGNPTSPVSPSRNQKPLNCVSSQGSTVPNPPLGCYLSAITCSPSRQRGSDSEGRFPSSPSDICHSADLRRAALLRSVHMRTHPHSPPALDLPFCSGQEPEDMQNIDETAEERSLPETDEYPLCIQESEHSQEKCYGFSNLGMRANGMGRVGLFSARRSVLGGSAEDH